MQVDGDTDNNKMHCFTPEGNNKSQSATLQKRDKMINESLKSMFTRAPCQGLSCGKCVIN